MLRNAESPVIKLVDDADVFGYVDGAFEIDHIRDLAGIAVPGRGEGANVATGLQTVEGLVQRCVHFGRTVSERSEQLHALEVIAAQADPLHGSGSVDTLVAKVAEVSVAVQIRQCSRRTDQAGRGRYHGAGRLVGGIDGQAEFDGASAR